MMKSCFILLGTILFSGIASAAVLEKNNNGWTVKNQNYTVLFEKQKGYLPSLKSLNGKKLIYGSFTPELYTSGEREKYNGEYCSSDDSFISRSALSVQPEILSENPDKIIFRFLWKNQAADVEEIVTLDNSSLIRYDVTINHSKRLGRHQLSLQLNAPSAKDFLFYPDLKRVGGVWGGNGELAEGSSWRYAWFGKDKIGLGIIAPPADYLAGLEYSMQRLQDGWNGNFANMRIIYSPLGQAGMNGTHKFTYYVIAGGTPENAVSAAEAILGKDSRISFSGFETQMVTVRPGNENFVHAELRNTTGQHSEAVMKTKIIYGLAEEQLIDSRTVALAPGETKKISFSVRPPENAKKGIAVVSELFSADGKQLDKKSDFFSVTDFAPRDSGFGLINVELLRQHGSQDDWNTILRKHYIGGYEYYCWAPSVIGGLAPEEEKWVPQTEHNYRNPITKTFLKELIANAKSKGIGVYAWITGLWSFREALQYPEWLQFAKNGQPNVYSGSTNHPHGFRRVIMKANMFYPDRAAIWGNEMADSVDMFGWAGCRWDWTFIPSSSNDPLHMDKKMEDWYDHNGIPASKLFPNPDQTGFDCLRAWREAVEKRHPDFIFGTNYSLDDNEFKAYPKWAEEASRNAVVLFENLLSYASKKRNTFEKWGEALARQADKVRLNHAAPVVGAMRGLPTSSVSYQLANYTAAAAGVKWLAAYPRKLLENSQVRNRFFLRFAEYYYSTDFLRPEHCPVTVSGNGKVLYKPFVRERKTADGKEVIVPVVNLPEESDYICEFHMKPPVRKLSCRLNEGTAAEAWLMIPQSPEKAVKLEIRDQTVEVPELHDAALILFKVKE